MQHHSPIFFPITVPIFREISPILLEQLSNTIRLTNALLFYIKTITKHVFCMTFNKPSEAQNFRRFALLSGYLIMVILTKIKTFWICHLFFVVNIAIFAPKNKK